MPVRSVPTKDNFLDVVNRVALDDSDFNIDKYKLGTSGESQLIRDLKDAAGLNET